MNPLIFREYDIRARVEIDLSAAEVFLLGRARAFFRDGGYYWNSGMFLFRREVIIEAMARHLPELFQELRLAGEGKQSVEAAYQNIPRLSSQTGGGSPGPASQPTAT